MYREPSTAEVLHDGLFERQRCVVTGNGDHSYIGNGRKRGSRVGIGSLANHLNAARPQRIGRERRDVATSGQHDRAPIFEHARVGLGDHLKTSHSNRYVTLACITPQYMHTLLTARDIHQRVRDMGHQIRRDHPDNVHLVCVLKGAFVFLADLARAIEGPVTLDFMAVSSYGASTTSSGQVQLLKDLDHPIEGRDVVVVEDIVDTGLTLHYLLEILRARSPRSLRVACLLNKPSSRRIDVPVDYIGFAIEDQFVVGYGLDHAEQYRNLADIVVIGN